jgi:hypothetical protein
MLIVFAICNRGCRQEIWPLPSYLGQTKTHAIIYVLVELMTLPICICTWDRKKRVRNNRFDIFFSPCLSSKLKMLCKPQQIYNINVPTNLVKFMEINISVFLKMPSMKIQ